MEELKLTRQNISVYAESTCNTVEQPIDCDITLPDYCNDIQKVIKCIAVPGVASVSSSGSRIQAEGSVTVRILYVDEEEELNTYEQSLPFAKYIESSELGNNVFVNCTVRTGYINCRAVNKRRIDVHGAVSLCFFAGNRDECNVITGDLSKCIERRTQKLKVASSVADAGRFFSVTQVETLKDRPAVGSLIRASSYAMVNEVKVIKDKALVKGDLLISISYKTRSPGAIENYDLRLPVSQIVDAVGLDENEIIDTQLHVTQLNVIPKTDGGGEYRLLDISAKLMAEMHAYKEIEFEGITDAYCTEQPVCLERNVSPVLKFYEKVDETTVVRKSINSSVSGFEEVLDVWCYDITSSYRTSENRVEIYGTANVGVIGSSAENGYSFFEQSIDFKYSKEVGFSGEAFCVPCVRAVGSKSSSTGDGSVELALEISIRANIFEKSKVELVTDITPSEEDKPATDDGAAVTIYFATKGESIWDIARHYNTTVNSVITENSLTEEMITEETMLLIPR